MKAIEAYSLQNQKRAEKIRELQGRIAALEAENERLRVRVHQLLDCLEWVTSLYPSLEGGIEEKLKEAWPIKTQEAYQATPAPYPVREEETNED